MRCGRYCGLSSDAEPGFITSDVLLHTCISRRRTETATDMSHMSSCNMSQNMKTKVKINDLFITGHRSDVTYTVNDFL